MKALVILLGLFCSASSFAQLPREIPFEHIVHFEKALNQDGDTLFSWAYQEPYNFSMYYRKSKNGKNDYTWILTDSCVYAKTKAGLGNLKTFAKDLKSGYQTIHWKYSKNAFEGLDFGYLKELRADLNAMLGSFQVIPMLQRGTAEYTTRTNDSTKVFTHIQFDAGKARIAFDLEIYIKGMKFKGGDSYHYIANMTKGTYFKVDKNYPLSVFAHEHRVDFLDLYPSAETKMYAGRPAYAYKSAARPNNTYWICPSLSPILYELPHLELPGALVGMDVGSRVHTTLDTVIFTDTDFDTKTFSTGNIKLIALDSIYGSFIADNADLEKGTAFPKHSAYNVATQQNDSLSATKSYIVHIVMEPSKFWSKHKNYNAFAEQLAQSGRPYELVYIVPEGINTATFLNGALKLKGHIWADAETWQRNLLKNKGTGPMPNHTIVVEENQIISIHQGIPGAGLLEQLGRR